MSVNSLEREAEFKRSVSRYSRIYALVICSRETNRGTRYVLRFFVWGPKTRFRDVTHAFLALESKPRPWNRGPGMVSFKPPEQVIQEAAADIFHDVSSLPFEVM